MPKYRRLTLQELESLEKDFTRFLASQSIAPSDWLRMKEEEPDQMMNMIDLFSDIVMEKVMEKVQFLQHRSKSTIRVFHLAKDKAICTALETDDLNTDLTDAEHVAKLASGAPIPGKIRIFQLEKQYEKSRNEEVWDMLQRGCYQAEQSMFNALNNMYKETL